MAVQFILGRSGTGKTSYCIGQIIDALLATGDEPLILLVPEQATYQAERAILSDRRIAGYHRLNVLSFDRLGFMLSGKNTARPALSHIGRQMIVHRILRDRKSDLKIFGSSAHWPGLSRQIARTIEELHRYAGTPDDIERLLNELQKDPAWKLTALKFADIGLILKDYLHFVEDDFYDPDVQLTSACRVVKTADFVKGSRLWVDGFAGFTEAEFVLLNELLKVVAEAKIAFCLEPSNLNLKNPSVDEIDPVGFFEPTERTFCSLYRTIKKNNIPLDKPLVLGGAMRFSANPPLAHIERNLFRLNATKQKSAENVRIISAPNAREEVRFVAKQILRLIREKDYRYRDIAVIASDIDGYQHYIEAYFGDYGIPFFIDRRKPLNRHPAVQLICSALQAVTGGFSNSDIFTCLKTDLVPIKRCDIDLLENYCIAFGVSAEDWLGSEQWKFAGFDNDDFDERQINRIRQKAIAPLLELKEKLCPGGEKTETLEAEYFARAVFDFLDNLEVAKTLQSWIETAEQRKDNAAVDEHRQLYNRLVDIFDELVEVFGVSAMTAEDFNAILKSAFSQLTLAFIPPTLDQVLVGSIERSRHPDLKAVFLIGATQKQFPVPVAQESILSDDDREAAEKADFPLAPSSQRALVDRRYLAYIAFTRPSELLYITYPSVDDKGGDIHRSQFLTDLESLFEDLREESIAGLKPEIENIYSETELAELLCERLGKDSLSPDRRVDEKAAALLESICSDEQLGSLGSNVKAAVEYHNLARLDEDVDEALFGRRLECSATRLGTFAACPYRYFARYVLDLKKRKEFKLEPLDYGNFYHGILDSLLKRLNAEGKDFAAIDDEELLNLLNEQIESFIKKNAFLSNFVGRREYNEFVIRSACEVLERFVPAIAQMIRAGSFRPSLSEVSFGNVADSGQTIGTYEIALNDGRILSLSGKIDRLDFAEIDGEKIAVVFDYKRSKQSFSWSKVFHGLDVQLPIYMLAVRNSDGAGQMNTAGAFYIPVEISPKNAAFDELSNKAESFNYKAKGIFNGRFFKHLDRSIESGWSKFYSFSITSKDQQYGNYAKSASLKPDDFELVLKFAEDKIIRLAQEILSGKIDITPYRLGQNSPCGFCEYASVCRFDWQINDYHILDSPGKSEVLEKAGGPNG
ncbi:MAG: exodeoxyribonuclease V subunit gamma [Sedimentisphaerales bacterium]|nr:exodeoxyribonuclease V subunit gamma [Sedimentisphaerales bacterium]